MNQNDRLNGWKEISEYLGRSVRTVQRWERALGLPVRRMGLPGGEIIFASRSEVDRWKLIRGRQMGRSGSEDADSSDVNLGAVVEKSGTEREAEPAASQASAAPVKGNHFAGLSRYTGLLAFLIFGVLLAILVAVANLNLFSRERPSAYELQGNVLLIRDEVGKPLWRYEFPGPAMPPEWNQSLSRFWTGDLDGDGFTEVLFAYTPADRDAGEVALYCFSEAGKLRWNFKPGKRVRTSTEEFGAQFNFAGFAVAKTPAGLRIVVASNQLQSFPAQVAQLNPEGGLVSEYWHSGHLDTINLADLDGDGTPEVVTGGVDQGYRQASLVVLDIMSIAGASAEEDTKYQLEDMPRASERARILFPRGCVNRTGSEANFVALVGVSSSLLTVHVVETPEAHMVYQLGYDLMLRMVSPSDSYYTAHSTLEREGKLHHPWQESEMEEFHRLRYLQTNAAEHAVGAEFPRGKR